jgi:hypothetical protein
MGTIGSIISIISAIIQIWKLIGTLKTQSLLNSITKGVEQQKNAKTPEEKSAAAKNMVDLISRL